MRFSIHSSRVFVTLALVASVVAACNNRTVDPTQIKVEIGQKSFDLAKALNSGQVDAMTTMLHPDAPKQWREDPKSNPLLAGFIQGKYQQIRAMPMQPDIMADQQYAEFFLYKVQKMPDSEAVQNVQVGSVDTYWRMGSSGHWGIAEIKVNVR